MKIQVLHGDGGAICAIFAPIDETRGGRIASPSPDRYVVEVDMPDVDLPENSRDMDIDTGAAKLAYLTDHFVVADGRLVPRSD
jgi:hypothetical protein